MTVIVIIVYGTFAVYVGYIGRHTYIGSIGCFGLSLVLTPLLIGPLIWLFAPNKNSNVNDGS